VSSLIAFTRGFGRIKSEDSVYCNVSTRPANQDNVKLLALNVCGLTKKLKFDLFRETIIKYKILCFTEIKADEIDCITIKKYADDLGYQCFCKPRKQATRKSGGMCVFFHKDIAHYAREIKSNLETVQWFVLDRKLLGIDKDLLLGNVYLPPANSPYANDQMFSELEMSLLELNYTTYYSLIAGDFNAHTSTKEDFIDLSEEIAADVNVINCREALEANNCKIQRSNQDNSRCDTHGNKLLQLCKTTGLCIFNGRVYGDERGVCTTSKNTSIDYILGTPNIIGNILSLHVEDFDSIFSDVHNMITLTFKATTNTHATHHDDAVKINRWKNEKEKDFIDNLNQETLQNIANLLEQAGSSVNDVNKEISKALLESAEKTLGKRHTRPPVKINCNHNYECRMKKREYNRAKTKLKTQQNTFKYPK